jgi:hypothetical protein
VIDTAEVANCCHHRDGHGAWHAMQSLKGLDHRGQAQRFHVILPFLCQTLEAFGVFGNGSDICLKDDLLRRCLTNAFREAPEMGRAPMGPARVADVMPAQEGLEPKFRLRDGNNDLLKDFDDYCEGAITEIVALSREVTDRATAIRAQYGFKTPDVIHLSAAAVIWGAICSSPMTIGLIAFPIE